MTNTRLNGLSYPVAIVSSTTNYPDDVIVTDTIQYLYTSSQLTVSNAYSVFGTNSGVMGTSLLGFRLDNIMSTQVYFSIQCTAADIAANTMITFDRVLVNVGNAWSTVNNAFTAPYDGNYFFSFATGAPTGSSAVSIFLVVGSSYCGAAYINDTIHNGSIMARGAAMLQLPANTVVICVSNGAGNYGSTDGLISAQGFLYSPLGGAAAAVAWGVMGPSSPVTILPFTTVNVNLQGVWDTTTNKVTIPVAGTYFIDLTAVLAGSAAIGCYGTNGNDGV
jgi:hypothetical protein